MATPRQVLNDILKCNVPAFTEDNFNRLQIDPNERTEIEKRVALLQQQLANMSVGGSNVKTLDQQAIRDINTRNMIRIGRAVRMQTFNPDRVSSIQQFIVNELGIVHKWLGMGDAFTNAGWVRESMNRVRRLWRGGVNQLWRDYAIAAETRRGYRNVVDVLKKKGLRLDQIDRITTDLAEIAYYPILRNSQDLGTRGLALLDKKYANFIDSLYSNYHLTQGEVTTLLDEGTRIAERNHRLLLAVNEAGIDVHATDTWGYFNRVMSVDAERRMFWRYADKNHVQWNTMESSPVTESFLKSRTTNRYIVEDEALFDFVVRSLGDTDAQDPEYYYKLALGESGGSVADVLDSEYGLAQVLSATLENRHEEVFEAMINSGLLSKIPYTTVEVYEYLRDTLKFPFDNLREVFATDWNTGQQVYREQLAKTAEESGFVNLMVKASVEDGWGVSATQVAMNPEKYQGWVPLRTAINPRILRKSFQQYNPIVGNVFVHPLVAQLAKSQQDLVMSPTALSSFGRIIKSINTRFKTLALATAEYIPRQVWQNLISLGAGGGNILMYPINTSKFMLYELLHLRNPELAYKVFDNTRQIYRTADGRLLTQLELVQYLEDTGTLSRFEPLTGGELNPGKYAPNGARRQLRYLADTLSQGRPIRAAEEGLEIAGTVLDRLTYPLAWSNNWLNNSSVFTLIESTTKQPNPLHEAIRRAGTLSSASFYSFDTVDEAIQHARNYFYYYDDTTRLNQTISNYVVPFWGFTSKNIPATVRYVIRHPSRFAAWQQMYALANSPVQDDEWLNEGSVPEWLLHTNPIWFKIPGGRSDGRDEYFALPMEPIDPLMSGLNWVTEPAESLLNMFGIWTEHSVQTTSERISRHPWERTGTNQAIAQVLESSYPLWKGLAAEISGEDQFGRVLNEGETVDSFLGLRMSPRMRMWLETLAPVLRTIDSANPGGVFGTPSQYDVNAGEWTLGQPSVFGVRRSTRDVFSTGNRFEALRYSGVKIYPVDVYMNAGLTYDQLTFDIIEGRKFVAKAKEDAALMPEGAARVQRENEIAEMEYIIEQSREDLIRFQSFMRREGLNPKQAYQRLRQRNVRIGDLPNATQE